MQQRVDHELLPEEQLTEMAREGDPQAFGELVRRSRSKMYNWAHSLTQDHHMAEDVVQEALVQAFLHVGRLVDAGGSQRTDGVSTGNQTSRSRGPTSIGTIV